jgi:Rha family phage regulatory protein
MNDIILSTQNGEPVASSREVAKRFGKNHRDVLRAIEDILEGVRKIAQTPKDITAQNCAVTQMFFKSEYTHPQNHQKYPMYLMNRDGFSLLAMGFTGKEAVQWKLKYIEAFNEMEKKLAAQHKEQQAVQDANIQGAIDRVIEARKKLDENTAFLDECRKNREDSKAKYMQVKALCGEFKAIYGQHCDTVRTMENVVRGSQSYLTSAIDSLTIVAKGYPFYAALMDSLLDGLPAKKKEE